LLSFYCFYKRSQWGWDLSPASPSTAHTSQSLLPAAQLLSEARVRTHMVVTALGSSQYQAWVQHVTLLLLVIISTSVDMGAPALDLPPIHDDGGINGYRVGLQGPGLGALTLYLPTFGISGTEDEIRAWGRTWVLQSFVFLGQDSRCGWGGTNVRGNECALGTH
jgi:hypothetical protein